jgi:hypothetical protein
MENKEVIFFRGLFPSGLNGFTATIIVDGETEIVLGVNINVVEELVQFFKGKDYKSQDLALPATVKAIKGETGYRLYLEADSQKELQLVMRQLQARQAADQIKRSTRVYRKNNKF